MACVQRRIADPCRPGALLVWCKSCAEHKPDSMFYSSAVSRGFYYCTRCANERSVALRKRKHQALGAQPALRKAKPISVVECMKVILAGGELEINGEHVTLASLQRGGNASPNAGRCEGVRADTCVAQNTPDRCCELQATNACAVQDTPAPSRLTAGKLAAILAATSQMPAVVVEGDLSRIRGGGLLPKGQQRSGAAL
jgi:hypothetical protein